jgi:hypothetical protein
MDKKDKLKEEEKDQQPKSTDPQEKMEGPISSVVQNIKEGAEENDDESKEEADKKKDKNT